MTAIARIKPADERLNASHPPFDEPGLPEGVGVGVGSSSSSSDNSNYIANLRCPSLEPSLTSVSPSGENAYVPPSVISFVLASASMRP